MDRARLALLVVCAMLTTTLEPFSDRTNTASSTSPAASQPMGLAVASDLDTSHERQTTTLPGTAHNGLAAKNVSEDPKLVALILKRLAMRHTALPQRERLALVYTILREARAQNLEPGLVVAVIEVESAGYHLAVSHVGAMGLMQLLPSTGEELAGKMGIEWKGNDTLFDPEINVRLGTAYLRELADRFGSVHTALAAYNWGPGAINRRIRRGATIPSGYIEQVMQAADRSEMTLVSRS